ncbi:MAG: hypothetical protein HY096_06765 [Nitrospinae bacterium]|nr:hypothetical protein [Nitrospinota bacterium]
MKSKTLSLFLIILILHACTAPPLRKTLKIDHPPKIGIIGFKVTAPISSLSSIVQSPPKGISKEEEKELINKRLRDIEEKADSFLIKDLIEKGKAVPVKIPEGLFGTKRGEKPELEALENLRKEFGLDAVLYGEIPWYGKTRLIYPILGISLDIIGESVIIGSVTNWNETIISANIGFELLTSVPLWFGGAYFFGVAFRPVTVDAHVVSTSEGTEIWHKSVDRIVSRRILIKYPESERAKKEVQLDASLLIAISAIAESLSME